MRKRVSSGVLLAGAVIAAAGVPSALAAQAAPASVAEAVTPDWQAVLDAANDEGEVVWYHVNFPAEVERVVEAFEARYPDIDVETVRVLAEAQATLEAEMSTGAEGADVVTVANRDIAPTLRDADGLSPLPAAGPHLAAWEGTDSLLTDDTFVAHYVLKGIAYNTDLVSESLTSYEDLLRPEFANGQIGVPIAKAGGSAAFWMFLEKHMGAEFVEALAEQEPRFYETGAPMDQALIAGEISVSIYSGPTILEEQANGAPIEYVQVRPSWGAPIDAFGVAWATHPSAAQVLLDYLLSPEGQAVLATQSAPALTGVDGFINFEDVDPLVAPFAEFEAYVEKWNGIFGR